MSANLIPTDATLCHYGSGKGYIPGISISQFLPNSEAGFTILNGSTSTGQVMSLSSTPGFSVGEDTFTLSGGIDLPVDSLGKTYMIDASFVFTSTVNIAAGATNTVQLRCGLSGSVGSTVIAENNFGGAVTTSTNAVNFNVHCFYTSIVNNERIGLYNNTGQTITLTRRGYITVREIV
jgi:hypothetical protein